MYSYYHTQWRVDVYPFDEFVGDIQLQIAILMLNKVKFYLLLT